MPLSRRRVLVGLALAAPSQWVEAQQPSVLAQAMHGVTAPGMAALVIRDFQAGSEQVAGIRRLGAAVPIAPGDRWHLGSDTKAMTATLIARLVERGRLSWTRTLDQMLPQFTATMDASYRDVTLPDLLSHRSGLPENASSHTLFASFYGDHAPLPAQRLRYIDQALRDPPAAPKRAAISYSNTGVIVAAACAEQATHRPYEDLISAEVFQLLGMRSATFDQVAGPNEPCGHVDGRPATQPLDPNPDMLAPAGGARMSLPDWSRFCIDQMLGEHSRGQLLHAETYRFLHTAQGGTHSALGWGASPTPMHLQGPGLTHAGSDGNWYAVAALFPQTGNGVLVTANAAESMGGDHATSQAIHALAATIAAPAPS
jgi:CubicO group peptidase (beta-lactamase class C family)